MLLHYYSRTFNCPPTPPPQNKPNDDKWHCKTVGNKKMEAIIKSGNSETKQGNSEKSFRINFKLKLKKHIKNICKKVTKNSMYLLEYLIL